MRARGAWGRTARPDRPEGLRPVSAGGCRGDGSSDDRPEGDLERTEQMRATWVVGFEGAHSTVPRAAGIAFAGGPSTGSPADPVAS